MLNNVQQYLLMNGSTLRSTLKPEIARLTDVWKSGGGFVLGTDPTANSLTHHFASNNNLIVPGHNAVLESDIIGQVDLRPLGEQSPQSHYRGTLGQARYLSHLAIITGRNPAQRLSRFLNIGLEDQKQQDVLDALDWKVTTLHWSKILISAPLFANRFFVDTFIRKGLLVFTETHGLSLKDARGLARAHLGPKTYSKLHWSKTPKGTATADEIPKLPHVVAQLLFDQFVAEFGEISAADENASTRQLVARFMTSDWAQENVPRKFLTRKPSVRALTNMIRHYRSYGIDIAPLDAILDKHGMSYRAVLKIYEDFLGQARKGANGKDVIHQAFELGLNQFTRYSTGNFTWLASAFRAWGIVADGLIEELNFSGFREIHQKAHEWHQLPHDTRPLLLAFMYPDHANDLGKAQRIFVHQLANERYSEDKRREVLAIAEAAGITSTFRMPVPLFRLVSLHYSETPQTELIDDPLSIWHKILAKHDKSSDELFAEIFLPAFKRMITTPRFIGTVLGIDNNRSHEKKRPPTLEQMTRNNLVRHLMFLGIPPRQAAKWFDAMSTYAPNFLMRMHVAVIDVLSERLQLIQSTYPRQKRNALLQRLAQEESISHNELKAWFDKERRLQEQREGASKPAISDGKSMSWKDARKLAQGTSEGTIELISEVLADHELDRALEDELLRLRLVVAERRLSGMRVERLKARVLGTLEAIPTDQLSESARLLIAQNETAAEEPKPDEPETDESSTSPGDDDETPPTPTGPVQSLTF